ncbi:hypothetical protein [Streptomyces sp. NPDC048551]|uniref:hypothetical protein n=1 Tax=Streptomyces sp. NPDC048551 TaxID=3155758 RepID=UPI0034203E19
MTPRDRLAVLRRLFKEQPGPITTGMAHAYYRAHGIAPHRSTARRDLAVLVRQGLIVVTGDEYNARRFWLRTMGGGR